MLVCGSTALKFWLHKLDTIYWREIVDTDILCYKKDIPYIKEEYKKESNFSICNTFTGTDYIFIDTCEFLKKLYLNNKDKYYLDFESCCLLKNSHKYFYLGRYKKSYKHLEDYSKLFNIVPNVFNDLVFQEQSKLYTEYLIKYVYQEDFRLISFPNLNKNKHDFFTDHVKYYFDHDYIHSLVSIESQPAYVKCLVGEVKFSNNLFEILSFKDKVNLVLEEAYVLALERCLIPSLYGDKIPTSFCSKEAFKYALTRIATNITSGKFREFAANNFYMFLNKYNKDYYKNPLKELLK